MRLKTTPARMAAAAAAVALLGLLTACGSGSPARTASANASSASADAESPSFCSVKGPVVLAVSGRADSPAPKLTPCMTAAVASAAYSNTVVGIVEIDGRPKDLGFGTAGTAGMNQTAAGVFATKFVHKVAAAAGKVRATARHANVLNALNLAGRVVKGNGTGRGTVFLEDSGLQDVAPLNFTQPGQLEALPSAVVSFLSGEGELPDLKGITVVLVGIGDTAAPQQPLGIGLQNHLRAIWSAIITAGGGKVQVDPLPGQSEAPSGVPEVDLVPVPPLKKWPGTSPSITLPNTGPVGFQGDSARFRDPSAARQALGQIAGYLLDNPTAQVELTGTTAHFKGDAYDKFLSLQRANAVKSALVTLGASPAQIRTQGDGWDSPCYEYDGGPNGPEEKSAAEHNRSVIVTALPGKPTCHR